MTDYARMERHIRYHKIATAILILCILATAGKVSDAVRHHFPWYDDVAAPTTIILGLIARFVQNHSSMYRIE